MRLNWGTAPVIPLELLELALTLLAIVIAFVRPGSVTGSVSRWFVAIEQVVRRISERPALAVLLLALFPIVMRLALLPVYGPPQPFISDEFAYLLQSDTFASGRLTNPSPPFAQHFTSVYILTQPTYTAEYQPGQGMLLALGQFLTGVPWAGVVASMAMMCALVYWALLGWLPRIWAFAGTAIVVDIQLGVLSYWMNSYWGGCLPAIGGTLAFGALVRIRGGRAMWNALLAALGIVVLINTRALEGVILTLLIVAVLGYWAVRRELSVRTLLKRVLPPLLACGIAALAFTAYYNHRVTGRADEFPYLLYRDLYGIPQGFFWQKPVLTGTAAMPPDIRAEYEEQLRQHERRTSIKTLAAATGGKLRRLWGFYVGVPLTVTLVFSPFIWRGRNMALALTSLVLVLGLDNVLFFAFFPHYAAAVTLPIVLVIVQSIRRMRASGEAGLFLSRALPLVCVAGLLVPLAGRWIEGFVPSKWARLWETEFLHEITREKFVPQLESEPGRQLVLVRYKPYDGKTKFEWIYNKADIDKAKIVWARESADPEEDRRLIEHFAGRQVWLGEPDASPPAISEYKPAMAGN